ncbi:hypothetical protein B0H10DRAFT_2190724 [Mycena sp. CBHHK59/15]|nr:hypothetical protein B0H10DRAFT_2190724 [Mycena sp. CBHHK59/15]
MYHYPASNSVANFQKFQVVESSVLVLAIGAESRAKAVLKAVLGSDSKHLSASQGRLKRSESLLHRSATAQVEGWGEEDVRQHFEGLPAPTKGTAAWRSRWTSGRRICGTRSRAARGLEGPEAKIQTGQHILETTAFLTPPALRARDAAQHPTALARTKPPPPPSTAPAREASTSPQPSIMRPHGAPPSGSSSPRPLPARVAIPPRLEHPPPKRPATNNEDDLAPRRNAVSGGGGTPVAASPAFAKSQKNTSPAKELEAARSPLSSMVAAIRHCNTRLARLPRRNILGGGWL